jgi:hypothetical protein
MLGVVIDVVAHPALPALAASASAATSRIVEALRALATCVAWLITKGAGDESDDSSSDDDAGAHRASADADDDERRVAVPVFTYDVERQAEIVFRLFSIIARCVLLCGDSGVVYRADALTVSDNAAASAAPRVNASAVLRVLAATHSALASRGLCRYYRGAFLEVRVAGAQLRSLICLSVCAGRSWCCSVSLCCVRTATFARWRRARAHHAPRQMTTTS